MVYEILNPGRITRVMQQTQDVLTLPMPLLWLDRANRPKVSDNEMTLRDRSYIFAADIIAADSKALIRDSGDFKFEQYGSNKLKHGYAINEEMLKMLTRLQAGMAMDNEYFAFESYLGRKAKELVIGSEQRAEAMLNGMLADSFNYDRLGIKITATFGMPSDLKFNPVTAWTDAANAKPLTDIINCLQYALHHYGEAYDRITLTFTALQKIVATTEFIAAYRSLAFQYNQGSDSAVGSARAASPKFYIPFLANFIGAGLSNGNDEGRPVKVEIYEGQYREASVASNINAPVPFHPASNILTFTNSADDGQSTGWDLGSGEIIEPIVAGFGGTGMVGQFDGPAYGPVGYMTMADYQLNPPGLVMWNVNWVAPRRLRDTCSAKLTAW